MTETTTEADSRDRGRVHRGAEAMDRIRPGWVDEIDLNVLKLASRDACIVGQTFGYFPETMGKVAGLIDPDNALTLGMVHDDTYRSTAREVMVEHGFFTEDTDRYPFLESVWRERIEHRRQEALVNA